MFPVRLLYHTALVDAGLVRLRTDPYGWDERVAAAPGLPARGRRTLRKYTGGHRALIVHVLTINAVLFSAEVGAGR